MVQAQVENIKLSKIIDLAKIKNIRSFHDEENNKYYETAFTKIYQGKIFVWNWAACCLGSYWMIYRRSYLISLLMFLTNIFLFYSISSLPKIINEEISGDFLYLSRITAIIIIFVVPGYIGNYLYYKSLERKVNKGYNLLEREGIDYCGAVIAAFLASFLLTPLQYIYGLVYIYGFMMWAAARRKIALIKKQSH